MRDRDSEPENDGLIALWIWIAILLFIVGIAL